MCSLTRHLAVVSMIFAVSACSSEDAGTNGSTDAGTMADSSGGAHHVEDPSVEACEHTKDGPFADVTAGLDASTAPDATHEHTSVRVTLDEAGGQYAGGVSYAAAEAGDFVIFLTRDVPLTIASSSGDAVAIEATAAVDACTDVAVAHTVELEVGTYHLTLGPTTEASVGIVVEHAGGGHEHGDEHGADEGEGHAE